MRAARNANKGSGNLVSGILERSGTLFDGALFFEDGVDISEKKVKGLKLGRGCKRGVRRFWLGWNETAGKRIDRMRKGRRERACVEKERGDLARKTSRPTTTAAAMPSYVRGLQTLPSAGGINVNLELRVVATNPTQV